MRHRLVAPLALCGLALAAAAPAHASFPGANGKLAFGPTYMMPSNSIGTVTPDGRWQELSTGPVHGPANIAWSRDGAKLAFDGPATSLGSGRAIYVMNADGSGLRQVGRGDRLRHNPAWSPDGTKLAFVQDNGAGAGSGDVYTMTATGANLTRLTTSPSWDGSPDWSNDGTKIAYVCRSGGRAQVCLMSPTGAAKSVITGALALTEIAAPTWSPTSEEIAFEARAPGAEDLDVHVVARTGGASRRLTHDGALRPAWSPDGARVAHVHHVAEGDFVLRTVRASDGGDPREIVGTDAQFALDPGGWQPLG